MTTRSGGDGRAPDADDRLVALQSALGQLSRRQQEVLHPVVYQVMTIQQAADVLALPVGTARTHYERGRARELAVIDSSPAGAARRAELTPRELRVSTDYFLDLALATASAAAGLPSIGAVDWAPLTPAAVHLDLPSRRRN